MVCKGGVSHIRIRGISDLSFWFDCGFHFFGLDCFCGRWAAGLTRLKCGDAGRPSFPVSRSPFCLSSAVYCYCAFVRGIQLYAASRPRA